MKKNLLALSAFLLLFHFSFGQLEGAIKFAKSIKIPIIASGGISNIKDVTKLSKLRNAGVSGAIIGKAIYERKISLNDLTTLLISPSTRSN